MKTKFLLTMLFLAVCTSMSWAQKNVTIQSAKAGNLYERKDNQDFKDELNGTTHLKVTGVLNATDFNVIRSLQASLEQIDLSGITAIETYFGNQGTAGPSAGNAFYPAAELPKNSFDGFSKLNNVVLPANLQSIGSVCFRNCTNLTKLDLPAGLKYISGAGTFIHSGLSVINLPDGAEIKHINDPETGYIHQMSRTFLETNIKSFHVPANVKKIESAFPSYNDVFTSLTFAKNSQLEEFSGLYGNGFLKKLVFPEGLKILSGLDLLSGLEYIEIPSTLETIESSFFAEEINALKTIVSHAVFPPELGEWVTLSGIPDKSKVTLYVPANGLANYKEAAIWKDFAIKVIGSDAESQAIENFSDIVASVGEEINLSATASSKLPVTYTIADASIATLEGNKLTILKEGETTITAKQAGDGVNFQAVEKTIKLTVMNLAWLEAPTMIFSGTTAKIVGPSAAVAKFTKFYANNTELPMTNGVADLSEIPTGELLLKATTADGSEVIRLKVNKQ